MKLEKRQKMFLAIFFLGLVALVVDRTFLRPQGGARAASAESVGTGESVPPSLEAAGPEGKAPGARVAGRLNQLWAEETAALEPPRDPFALPPSWFDNVVEHGVRMADEVALFLHKHRLGAVVMEEEKTYALVNDRFLTPGQWLDGFQLVAVGDRSAVFEREGKRATLELAKE
jgi:hypothetical protein